MGNRSPAPPRPPSPPLAMDVLCSVPLAAGWAGVSVTTLRERRGGALHLALETSETAQTDAPRAAAAAALGRRLGDVQSFSRGSPVYSLLTTMRCVYRCTAFPRSTTLVFRRPSGGTATVAFARGEVFTDIPPAELARLRNFLSIFLSPEERAAEVHALDTARGPLPEAARRARFEAERDPEPPSDDPDMDAPLADLARLGRVGLARKRARTEAAEDALPLAALAQRAR